MSSTQLASKDQIIERLLNDSNYRVLDTGIIETLKHRSGQGYSNEWRVLGSKSGRYINVRYKGYRLQAHRIVYRKFKGELSPELVINHINGIKQDNRPANLELVTQAANEAHSTDVLGKSHYKITPKIAKAIRHDHKTLGLNQRELGLIYGLHQVNIGRILNNKSWNRAA